MQTSAGFRTWSAGCRRDPDWEDRQTSTEGARRTHRSCAVRLASPKQDRWRPRSNARISPVEARSCWPDGWCAREIGASARRRRGSHPLSDYDKQLVLVFGHVDQSSGVAHPPRRSATIVTSFLSCAPGSRSPRNMKMIVVARLGHTIPCRRHPSGCYTPRPLRPLPPHLRFPRFCARVRPLILLRVPQPPLAPSHTISPSHSSR